MAIEVYADIWCPFAHLSLGSLRRLRNQISPGVPIAVRAWPLELVNGVALDPAATGLHVAELQRDVAPGLFVGFRPEAMPRSTLKALALVEAANDSDPWLGEHLSFDLREMLFEQGRHIDDELLGRLATQYGFDPSVLDEVARVEWRLAEGRRRGVQGSPHVFVGACNLFCPLLDIDKGEPGGLHLHERLERLRSLLVEGLTTEASPPGPPQTGERGCAPR